MREQKRGNEADAIWLIESVDFQGKKRKKHVQKEKNTCVFSYLRTHWYVIFQKNPKN